MKIFVPWLTLLVLLGIEFAVGRSGGGGVTPFIGIGMAVLVALCFMRPRAAPGLASVFAIAGVFWLIVLMGLGSLDQATRHDVRVPYTYQPAPF